MLYKKGWYGVNIDLDSENINLFNLSRPKDYNVLSAISEKSREAYFIIIRSHHINTLIKKLA